MEPIFLKFIYSDMATKTSKFFWRYWVVSNWIRIFFKFGGLLKIYELYIQYILNWPKNHGFPAQFWNTEWVAPLSKKSIFKINIWESEKLSISVKGVDTHLETGRLYQFFVLWVRDLEKRFFPFNKQKKNLLLYWWYYLIFFQNLL